MWFMHVLTQNVQFNFVLGRCLSRWKTWIRLCPTRIFWANISFGLESMSSSGCLRTSELVKFDLVIQSSTQSLLRYLNCRLESSTIWRVTSRLNCKLKVFDSILQIEVSSRLWFWGSHAWLTSNLNNSLQVSISRYLCFSTGWVLKLPAWRYRILLAVEHRFRLLILFFHVLRREMKLYHRHILWLMIAQNWIFLPLKSL